MLMMFEHFAGINIKLQQENCRYASARPLQGLSPLEACFRFRPADGYGGVWNLDDLRVVDADGSSVSEPLPVPVAPVPHAIFEGVGPVIEH